MRRAFPELGHFTPRDFDEMLEESRRARTARERIAGDVPSAFAQLALTIVGVWALTWLLDPVPGGEAFGWALYARLLAFIAGLFALATSIAVPFERAREGAAIRRRLEFPARSDCGYSLAGLPAPRSETRCPECGADQLVAPTRTESESEPPVPTDR